jgi:hypothetical protein
LALCVCTAPSSDVFPLPTVPLGAAQEVGQKFVRSWQKKAKCQCQVPTQVPTHVSTAHIKTACISSFFEEHLAGDVNDVDDDHVMTWMMMRAIRACHNDDDAHVITYSSRTRQGCFVKESGAGGQTEGCLVHVKWRQARAGFVKYFA